MKVISDPRKFKKLRISLTDSCNFACSYCVSEDQALQVRRDVPELSTHQYLKIAEQLHKKLSLNKVRLTGGEPLMYKDIVALVAGLKNMGIANIGLTTNAYYLKHLAGKLKHAGISSINVSLDAMDANIFKTMTRKPLLKEVLEGIKAALRYGIDLKMNAVVLKGVNESEVLPLLDFALENAIPIRFLELMKMGYLHHDFERFFLSQEKILAIVQSKYEVHRMLREKSSTANYWELLNKRYQFGIIANESEPFCSDCDRLRLDSYGNIFGCISASKGISAMDKSDKELESILALALQQKQKYFVGSKISMRHLGG